MVAKLTKSIQSVAYLTAGPRRLDKAKTLGKLIVIKHTCPCCSETLLRHIRFGGIYWRCSYCHQEMPI
ncbi:MAG TPA: hypothetical protein DDZ80_13405 [Cyanobacteria bacterium UBA8803]|nr:hypothetical protein [Cyanobacteria bacterium UBA9273]HBL59467.1 hypothetical protein [Cyanobacteria bacterium UBA8803]